MSKHLPPKDIPEDIRNIPLPDALSERYLAYAMSTITARSLPDVRDGLKPVQRRVLFAMRLLKLDPNAGYKKCARVVGDVIGKYHPHGDQSVYDALVRLAQDFAQRYPLVDGQGNFGNIDGDNAAAMRYTEARLTEVANVLLAGLDDDTVDFRPNYDGENDEPVVLPAGLPNLLANGASGIAVGMATSIPPHNLPELCDALLHLIKHRNATIEKLVEFVQGPDFPTGGILVEPLATRIEAYKTGRGSFRLRARWHKEDLPRGTWQIVVTEIPYQVQKSRLIEKIAELITERKAPLLDDVRDESAEDIRLVLVPKSKNVDPAVLMESLFRSTDLETRFPLNLNVLDHGRQPKVMNLREALQAYLDHRHEVLERRSKFRLGKIEHRLEVLDGYLIAYLNLDEVIEIIRREDEPKPVLMKRFKLTDVQAEAILNMRLRSLRRLEEMEIRGEHKKLSQEKAELKKLLGDEGLRWQAISGEIQELKKQFGPKTALGKRRTSIADAPVISEEAFEVLVEREPITVICSAKGWIRAVKGHVEDEGTASFKEGDKGRFWLHAETTDKLLLFGTNGRAYTIACDKLPRGRGHGEPVRLMVDLGNDQDIVALFKYQGDRKLLVASSDGRGFICPEAEMLAGTRTGKQILNVAAPAEACVCRPVEGDMVAVVGDNRKLLLFPLDQLPEMTRGRGITLQKYKDGGLADAKTFAWKQGLSWTDSSGRVKTETDLKEYRGERAQAGRIAPRGFNKNNRFG
ncbi:MAG TPA: DNA topoisomerase IV subunit A [Ferrovibrio sp.]|uniref:DNA topoisomerase IV subunit A n=1 Tax=Ferrovibrio sp. TaxID=1917215 RepID=UPI002B4AEB74|nr:DNA topoisomerase IV subunit A [Ferrovibrio sp.]HLT75803.1 DNA topoisomerase IV subunit A [Ferrovibrio sp.]